MVNSKSYFGDDTWHPWMPDEGQRFFILSHHEVIMTGIWGTHPHGGFAYGLYRVFRTEAEAVACRGLNQMRRKWAMISMELEPGLAERGWTRHVNEERWFPAWNRHLEAFSWVKVSPGQPQSLPDVMGLVSPPHHNEAVRLMGHEDLRSMILGPPRPKV